jgi:hypothetical protein
MFVDGALPSQEHALIRHWLNDHPRAKVIPISSYSREILRDRPPVPISYVWIEDAHDSLTLFLVREGIYRAEMLKDTVEKPLPVEVPDETPVRLVNDPDYAERMKRAVSAELDAQRAARGMWSPAGLKRWNPPTDDQMISQYHHHTSWFRRINELVASDARLADIAREPVSLRKAREAGIRREPQGVRPIAGETRRQRDTRQRRGDRTDLRHHHRHLLRLHGRHHQRIVFSPKDPRPVVDDLEDPSHPDVSTRYRPVADGRHLFEVSD